MEKRKTQRGKKTKQEQVEFVFLCRCVSNKGEGTKAWTGPPQGLKGAGNVGSFSLGELVKHKNHPKELRDIHQQELTHKQ